MKPFLFSFLILMKPVLDIVMDGRTYLPSYALRQHYNISTKVDFFSPSFRGQFIVEDSRSLGYVHISKEYKGRIGGVTPFFL